MIVLDASAAVDLLLRRHRATETRAAIAAERVLHAPHLLDTEVLSALRRRTARGELEPERAASALAVLGELPLERHAHAPLSRRVWALRDRLSAFDATYLALAEVLAGSLVTADAGLATAAGEVVRVIDVS